MSEVMKISDLWGNYNKAISWKYLPPLGSLVCVGFWSWSFRNSLWDQAILLDSWLPIIEAHRIDNILLWMAQTAGLGILVYFVLAVVTMLYHNSVTTSSDMLDLLESTKSKMRITLKVNLRIHNEEGKSVIRHRNILFSSLVFSRDAQAAILHQHELGEVVLADELSYLKNRRPWFSFGGLVSFLLYFGFDIMPDPYFTDLLDAYGWIAIPTEFLFLLALMLLGFGLITNGLPDFRKSEMKTTNEYHILPSIARKIVFEGLVISEDEIKKQTKLGSNFGVSKHNDRWLISGGITFIGSLFTALILWLMFAEIAAQYEISESIAFLFWLITSIFAIVCFFLLTAFKFNLIDDSRPSPYYELENSS